MATTNVTITINTPSGVTVAQALDTLCDYWGYAPAHGTKAEFVKAKVARFVKESYIAAKATPSAEAARLAAIAKAEEMGVE